MRARLGILAVVALVGITACGSDDDDAESTSAATTVETTATGSPDAVEVVATDYKFSGLPDSVPAGTAFTLKNDSTAEVHEMIMIRIPDEEKRPVGELVALPEAEADAVFGQTEPATVLVALPGTAGQAVEGDGTITEPGRYAVVCFIPVGADPAAVEAAMTDPDATGPPDLGDGPPHVANGMFAELTVS